MIINTNCPQFFNDISESIRAFLPGEEITEGENAQLTLRLEPQFTATATYNGVSSSTEVIPRSLDAFELKRCAKRCAKLSVYKLLSSCFNKQLPWGSLTGIRPTKLFYENGAGEEAYSLLGQTLGVSQEKLALLSQITQQQRAYIDFPAGVIDVYIGIPFCRTRCVYCSFATHDATKHKLIPQYMGALLSEIKSVKALLSSLDLRVRCLYIGGGTPTALPDEQFALLCAAASGFNPQTEFTVEAGRPDTINQSKLQSMKENGVNRISINPQTMNDDTLKLIGRQHTTKQIEQCFDAARSMGFNSINADLIAGLPGESLDMFVNSVNRMLAIRPDNITVHTLSLKSGSALKENPDKYPMPQEQTVMAMVDSAREMLTAAGYAPYYLYRQKYQAGNLENVGYCLNNKQCVYNIDIMEETGSIVALGAGAISKRVFGADNRIERAANSKSITDYVARIDEMTEKKKALFNL